MPTDGYVPVKKLFSGHTPDSSKANALTSICFGIYWLGYKTAALGSIQKGIAGYNGGGNKNYLSDVLSCASNPKNYLKNEKGCTIS